MKFSLKNKVLPVGFNKRAVIIAFGIVFLIIACFMWYVTTNNAIGGGVVANEEPKKVEIHDDAANVATIAEITGQKSVASVPATDPSADESVGLHSTSGEVNASNKTVATTQTIQHIKAETEFDKQVKQIEDQAKMKKIQSQFAALNSKSSMIGSSNQDNASPANNQASNKSTLQKTNTNSAMSDMTGNTSSNNVTNGSATSGTTGETTVAASDGDTGSELVKPKSPYLVQAGSIIPCVMISGINSDISGQVIAQVRENVYDSISSRYLLIPQGSKLLGSFSNQVAYGQQRLGVAWTRIIYPNGYSIDLKGIPGSDVSGFSGFYDQVNNHYWSIFGSSFVIGMITAGMQYSQNNTNPNVQAGGIGISTSPTIGQTVSGSLGQQLGQTAMMVTQKGLNVAPTLTIRQGYMFTVMLTADIALRPYKQD